MPALSLPTDRIKYSPSWLDRSFLSLSKVMKLSKWLVYFCHWNLLQLTSLNLRFDFPTRFACFPYYLPVGPIQEKFWTTKKSMKLFKKTQNFQKAQGCYSQNVLGWSESMHGSCALMSQFLVMISQYFTIWVSSQIILEVCV